MKRIPVMRLFQKDQEFYFMVADPREIIREVDYPKKDTVQDFQRPWKETRVKALSKYIAGKDTLSSDKHQTNYAIGLLPACAIINIKDNINIKKEGDAYFLEFPETSEECATCKGSIEVIDGQHRLIAFDEDYIDEEFKDSEKYDMGFIVFNRLTGNLKKEVFIVTNDRVEKVDKTVLQNMMMGLGVLPQAVGELYQLAVLMNVEDSSPLKGRINIDGGKFKNCINVLQLQAVLQKSGTLSCLPSPASPDKKLKLLNIYLEAWEEAYGLDFNKKSKVNTLEKISGFRYVFNLYKPIVEILKLKGIPYNKDNIHDVLKTLQEHEIMPLNYKDIPSIKDAFRGDSATVKMATEHGEKLKNVYLQGDIDIFQGLV